MLCGQVVMIARDCWSNGESYKFSAGSESVELLPAFAGGIVLASLLSMFAMLVMTPGTCLFRKFARLRNYLLCVKWDVEL